VKFATYERDSTASAQDYAGQRYYSNVFGRFFSPDPLGGDPKNPLSLNRYAYVMGDPVNLNDPLGLCPPGMVPADSAEDTSMILSAAVSYLNHGLAHDDSGQFGVSASGTLTSIDCSGLVSQALAGISYSDPFQQASTLFASSQTSSLFSADTSGFHAGDIIWFPGHVGILTGVNSSGQVTSFIGAQSSGVAEVDVTKNKYWANRMSSAKAYAPCVPADKHTPAPQPPIIGGGAPAPDPGATVPGGYYGGGSWLEALLDQLWLSSGHLHEEVTSSISYNID
jgi:RHS repeat-associated protein